MPNKSLSRSGLLTYQKYSSLLAGNDPYIPAPPSAYDLLETEILTGTQASVTFSSLNSTYGADYQHLQIRAVGRGTTASTAAEEVHIQINSDTGSNYSGHRLRGSGSAVSSTGYTSQSYIRTGVIPRNNETADIFGSFVIDILDPFETTKNTTIRSLTGSNASSSEIILFSGAWLDTSAVTTIKLYPEINSLLTGSRFSLYGLKASA